MAVLWASTWVLLANTALFAVSKGIAADPWHHLGVDWNPLLQQGLTATYLALLAVNLAEASGWWRVDLAGVAARIVPIESEQAGWVIGSLAVLAVGVGLASMVGLAIASLS